MSDLTNLRQAIVEALPAETSTFGQPPNLKDLYIPPAHIKALQLNCHLVIGARGAGKSIWAAALGNAELRQMLRSTVKELDNAEVKIGFSEKSDIDSYPDAETFSRLLKKYDGFHVWKAVVARWLAVCLQQSMPGTTSNAKWDATVEWVQNEPEAMARLVQAASAHFTVQRKYGLIVFDALDKSSQNWETMDGIVRDLLKTVLWLKSFPGLSAKAFLREDQYNRMVTNFPDASKITATRAELTWADYDLHGLLWHRFINAAAGHGSTLRAVYESATASVPALRLIETSDIRSFPNRVKRDIGAQRALFEKLAGPWMGRDKRRGVPYVWAVSHLADGGGRTSPRSFLAAIRQAAEDSLEKYPDYPWALHYESIKRGIQKASEIRVYEIREDYPWVPGLMAPLARMNVPCDYSAIQKRWEEKYPDGPASVAGDGLAPEHVANGWDGIRDDLIRIGIFKKRSDDRLDMPDLYRVGFHLGRRGGVKPDLQAG